MVKATALKIMVSRSSSMTWPFYWIKKKYTSWFKSW